MSLARGLAELRRGKLRAEFVNHAGDANAARRFVEDRAVAISWRQPCFLALYARGARADWFKNLAGRALAPLCTGGIVAAQAGRSSITVFRDFPTGQLLLLIESRGNLPGIFIHGWRRGDVGTANPALGLLLREDCGCHFCAAIFETRRRPTSWPTNGSASHTRFARAATDYSSRADSN